MKIRAILLGAAVVALAGVAAAWYVADYTARSLVGPKHVFELSERPEFLTADLALARVRETFQRDGLVFTDWTEANGTRFVSSNGMVFVFTNGVRTTRYVHVDLQSNRILCQIVKGK